MSFFTLPLMVTSGELFSGFDVIPSPMYIGGNWWSFCDAVNGTPSGEIATSITQLESELSTDSGVSWTIENTTASSGFNRVISASGNNLLLSVVNNSSTYSYKDISTSDNDWTDVDQTTLSGGFASGVYHSIEYDEDNSVFILCKADGGDIYTSANLTTWTPINGVSENGLSSLMEAYLVVRVGGQYVAHGVDLVDSSLRRVATSSDLLNWTLVTATIPVMLDIRYFSSGYLGVVNSGSGGITNRIVQVWRSTDFITWTQQTLPDVTTGSTFDRVWVESGMYELLSSTQVFSTTNGTTFTTTELKYNIEGIPSLESLAFVRGKQHKLSTSTPPDRIMMRTVNHREFGGKVIQWTTGLSGTPTLRFPSSHAYGATVGFIGASAILGSGIKDGGFTIVNAAKAEGFYLHRTGIRYFEIEVKASGTGKFGIHIPARDHFSGLNTTFVLLSSTGQVETSAGNLPVSYSMSQGQVIGFVVNFITAQVEIYVNNVLLTTIPNLSTSVAWTQYIECPSCELKMNIGQDPFVYTISGVSDWNS